MTTTIPETTATADGDVEIIVDNLQADITGGAWRTSTFQPNYYGSNYHFTDRSAFSATSRVARWRFNVPAAGEYVVSAWLPNGSGDRAPAVKYRVHHGGQISEFTLDHRESGGRWRPLGGLLQFDGSDNEFVELRVADVPGDLGGPTTYIHVDAVKVATPPPPVNTAPSNLAVAEGRNYLEISWDALEDAETYILSRSVDGGQTEVVAETPSSAYLDLDVLVGKTYTYTIRGVNVVGDGPESSALNAALTPGAPLQAVQGLAISNADRRPVLTWDAARDATAYQIERANRSGGRYRVIGETSGTEWVDRSRPREAFYIVRSLNQHGAAELSSWQVSWNWELS
ncbi:hypothetical protein GCM10027403_17260 [Arthrobacter tecti]